jgi:hypothetical protein
LIDFRWKVIYGHFIYHHVITTDIRKIDSWCGYISLEGEFEMKKVLASIVGVLATASFAMAGVGVGVDVATPNVRVQVGTPQPPPVTVVHQETVIVKEKGDNGKHKGHYKKHKKHKKHKD